MDKQNPSVRRPSGFGTAGQPRKAKPAPELKKETKAKPAKPRKEKRVRKEREPGKNRPILRILLGIAAAVFAALYFIQKRRIERLAARTEDFLVTGKNALEYSVREDSIAPVHNAAAELENRILLSKEQVRDELKRTSTLIADISHQLKTPLASLKLFCELDEGAHMEAQLSQIERMEKLIYSLLRLERLCADGYDFVFEDHEVGQIIREAWESVCPVWTGRTLKIDG